MKASRTLSRVLLATAGLTVVAVGLLISSNRGVVNSERGLVRVVIARVDSASLSIAVLHDDPHAPSNRWGRTESSGKDGRLEWRAFAESGEEFVGVQLVPLAGSANGEWMLSIASRQHVRIQLPPDSESVVRILPAEQGEAPLGTDFVCTPGDSAFRFRLPLESSGRLGVGASEVRLAIGLGSQVGFRDHRAVHCWEPPR